jgi:hypothetical protein
VVLKKVEADWRTGGLAEGRTLEIVSERSPLISSSDSESDILLGYNRILGVLLGR